MLWLFHAGSVAARRQLLAVMIVTLTFALPGGKNAQRYKMFVNAGLRAMVLKRLAQQLTASGTIMGSSTPKLGLIYGFATPSNAAILKDHFEQNDWGLYGPEWLRAHLQKMALRSYDNQIASVVAKLLLPRTAPAG